VVGGRIWLSTYGRSRARGTRYRVRGRR
jgi:hypothetical protein